jgi:hypothetical protein
MLKYVKNKAVAQYIYTKLLYIDNKEVVDLRIFLKSNGYMGGLKKKKYVQKIGFSQTYLTFIITSSEEKTINELKLFCVKLKNFELIQILGIIKKNILLTDETGVIQGFTFSQETCYKTVFFSKVLIFALWRKLLFSFRAKE